MESKRISFKEIILIKINRKNNIFKITNNLIFRLIFKKSTDLLVLRDIAQYIKYRGEYVENLL